MQDRLNILFLSSWYPCRKDPFNGNFVARHAEAVVKYANVYVIHVCSEAKLKSIEVKKDIINDVETRWIYYPKVRNNIPIISQISKYIKVKKLYIDAFLKLKKEIGTIHLIHTNIIFPVGLIARYFNKKFNIPFVVTEHWSIFLPVNRKRLSFPVLKLSQIIAKSASYILPVSNDLKKSLQLLNIKSNFKLVPNVVNTTLFTKKESEHKLFRFIHVSTLDSNKNVRGILRAVKNLSVKRTDFQILIMGDGDIQPHIKYARELNISDKIVSFEGAKPISDIASIMQQSDAFILFSFYESLPCVISESLCVGIPVISSNVGGISEMINDSNGILINANDEKALCNKMSFIIDNYNKYDSTEIRKKAVERYSYDNVGQQFVNIYKEVLKYK